MPEAARCLSQRERNSVSNGRKRLWAIAEQNEFVNVIDKKRLRGKYIGEDGKRIKPEKQKKRRIFARVGKYPPFLNFDTPVACSRG